MLPAPPSWQTPLYRPEHSSLQRNGYAHGGEGGNLGAGGEDGGGCNGGEEGGGEWGGGGEGIGGGGGKMVTGTALPQMVKPTLRWRLLTPALRMMTRSALYLWKVFTLYRGRTRQSQFLWAQRASRPLGGTCRLLAVTIHL